MPYENRTDHAVYKFACSLSVVFCEHLQEDSTDLALHSYNIIGLTMNS